MSPFLDETDLKKIVICHEYDDLKKYIDEKWIPKEYNGKSTYKRTTDEFIKRWNDKSLLFKDE